MKRYFFIILLAIFTATNSFAQSFKQHWVDGRYQMNKFNFGKDTVMIKMELTEDSFTFTHVYQYANLNMAYIKGQSGTWTVDSTPRILTRIPPQDTTRVLNKIIASYGKHPFKREYITEYKGTFTQADGSIIEAVLFDTRFRNGDLSPSIWMKFPGSSTWELFGTLKGHENCSNWVTQR